MDEAESENSIFFFLAYLIVGLPIAWLHVRKEKMSKSLSGLPTRTTSALVFYALVAVWPFIAISYVLNERQERVKREAKDNHEREQ